MSAAASRVALACAAAVGAVLACAHAVDARPLSVPSPASGGQTPASERPAASLETRLIECPAPLRIGDVVVVEIDVAGEGAQDATLPPAPDVGSLELAGDPVVERTADADGRPLTRITLRVQPFATGPAAIPALGLVSARTGARLPLQTSPITLTVEPLTTPGTPPSPAKLVLPPVRSAPLVPVVLAGLVVSALAYRSAMRAAGRAAPGEIALLASLVRRRRGRSRLAVAGELPDVAPAEQALASLGALTTRAAAGYEAVSMHAALWQIAARYVDRSRGLARCERTTTELLAAVRRRTPSADAASVARVMRSCDLVKFARSEPDATAFAALAGVFETFVRDEARTDAPDDRA